MTRVIGRKAMAAGAAAMALMALSRWRRRRREKRAQYDFRGKTVLITGGSRGLGLILAREFGARGSRVALCARDAGELARAADELEARGITAVPIVGDIGDPGDVSRVVQQVSARLGDVDVLVNNAGVIVVGPFDTMTASDYEEAMRVHFWGPLHMVTAVLPGMRRRGGGRIVNISSIGGKISVPHLLPYGASKCALAGLSQGLRGELEPQEILVTTVFPGLMRTGSARHALFKGRHRLEYSWFSIGASLPLLSMDADRAGRQIVDACGRGDAEIVLSALARMAVGFHARFPELTADLLALAGRLLPRPGGVGAHRVTGADSRSPVAPSPITVLADRAARRNNEGM